jgi:pimeloyl-ACP methyl ester carboxylesterase
MKIKNYVIGTIIVLSFYVQCTENLDNFYSTSFLKDYYAVEQLLKKYGFQDIFFKSSDNLNLHGLFLQRPFATCNVILCAGWLPGKKEGMATFYDIVPTDCNILFFDARGHGNSEGSLLWKLWEYGINEYKDILGAITYINNINELPIIIIGMCSGAFNATHALINLEQNKTLQESHVKGLVFDSGWGSVMEIARTAPPAGIEKRFHALIKCVYNDKKSLDQHYLIKWCSNIAQFGYLLSYYVCTRPLLRYYEPTTTLFDKIDQLSLPIFFIHSDDDTYAIKSDAVRLSQLAPHATHWWIEKSFHAKHHLIHRKLYKEKINTFINSILS